MNLHRSYDISGKKGITKKFNNIDVDPRDTLELKKRNHYFGLKHKLQLYKGLPKVG